MGSLEKQQNFGGGEAMKIIITEEEYIRCEKALEQLSLDTQENIRCESPDGELIMLLGGKL